MSTENSSVSEILKNLERSSPLEVLGVTRELAKELSTESLTIAVKGLYRALQLEHHPDRKATNSTERLLEIQSAYESIDDTSIEEIRASYIRPKRGAKNTKEAKLKNLSEELTTSIEIIQDKAMTYVEGLFLPESILNIERAIIAVKPLETDRRSSHNIISIEDGKIYSQKFQNIAGDDELAEEIGGILTDNLTHFCVVENGKISISGVNGDDTEKLGSILDDGYYIIYGYGGQSLRTLRPVQRKKEEIKMELAGSIDTDIRSVNEELNMIEIETGLQSESSRPTYNGQIISNGWKEGITGDINGFRLLPNIKNDRILALRTKDDLLALGNIEHKIVDYKFIK